MKTGDLVIVATEGGKPGVIRYITADNYYGVALVNERGRVDEWQKIQLTPATPKEASEAAKKFMPAEFYK